MIHKAMWAMGFERTTAGTVGTPQEAGACQDLTPFCFMGLQTHYRLGRGDWAGERHDPEHHGGAGCAVPRWTREHTAG